MLLVNYCLLSFCLLILKRPYASCTRTSLYSANPYINAVYNATVCTFYMAISELISSHFSFRIIVQTFETIIKLMSSVRDSEIFVKLIYCQMAICTVHKFKPRLEYINNDNNNNHHHHNHTTTTTTTTTNRNTNNNNNKLKPRLEEAVQVYHKLFNMCSYSIICQ